MVILEAMACNKPVVVIMTHQAGDNRGGRFNCDPSDTDQYAQALKKP